MDARDARGPRIVRSWLAWQRTSQLGLLRRTVATSSSVMSVGGLPERTHLRRLTGSGTSTSPLSPTDPSSLTACRVEGRVLLPRAPALWSLPCSTYDDADEARYPPFDMSSDSSGGGTHDSVPRMYRSGAPAKLDSARWAAEICSICLSLLPNSATREPRDRRRRDKAMTTTRSNGPHDGPHCDDLDEEAQAEARARWRRLIAERIRELDLAAEFEAEGRPFATLDGEGQVVVRGASR